jgi:hypothetical protein
VFLTIISVLFFFATIAALLQHIVLLILFAIPLGILWGMWTEIPAWFRTGVSRLLRRRRERRDGGGE